MLKKMRWIGFSAFLVLSMVSCSKGGNYLKKVVIQAPWGSAPGQFGLLQEAEGVGPEALAVDTDKNVWILDLVNSRVQEFNPAGQFIRALPIALRAMDLTIDEKNQIILLAPYDDQLAIMNNAGTVLRRFVLPSGLDLIEGIRLERNGLALTTSEQKSALLLSTTELTQIEQVPSLAKRTPTVQQGLSSPYSQHRFVTHWKSAQMGVIEIFDASGKKIKSIPVHSQTELGLIQFLNEDQKRNFYILEELLPAPKRSLFKVLRFSSAGVYVASVEIPNTNCIDVHKPILVDSDGSIYFLNVQTQKFEVIKWEWQ